MSGTRLSPSASAASAPSWAGRDCSRQSPAELLRRLGREQEARAAFGHALQLAASEPERRFLTRRLAQLQGRR